MINWNAVSPYIGLLILFLLTNWFTITIFGALYYYLDQYFRNKNMKNYKIDSETNILITGGSNGIGRCISQNFAQNHKCNLIIIDIREANEVKQECEQLGAKLEFYKCDLSDEDQLEQTFNQIIEKFKKIDILINNAGSLNYKRFQDLEYEKFKKVFQINYLAPVKLTKLALKGMLERNSGHIVNVSSVMSIASGPCLAEYCSSKSALAAFNNCLRTEMKLAEKNICLTVIHPAYVYNSGFYEIRKEPFLLRLMPKLEVKDVGREIYQGILQKREEVFISRGEKFMQHFLRILPSGAYDWILAKSQPQTNQVLLRQDIEKEKMKNE